MAYRYIKSVSRGMLIVNLPPLQTGGRARRVTFMPGTAPLKIHEADVKQSGISNLLEHGLLVDVTAQEEKRLRRLEMLDKARKKSKNLND